MYRIINGNNVGYVLPQCRDLSDSIINRVGKHKVNNVKINHFSN
jgi:hypothetical protein